MAEYRPKMSNVMRKQLLREAGDKCANPGCMTHVPTFGYRASELGRR
jgi:hypothetical protein